MRLMAHKCFNGLPNRTVPEAYSIILIVDSYETSEQYTTLNKLVQHSSSSWVGRGALR
jgi:hypothetical protein